MIYSSPLGPIRILSRDGKLEELVFLSGSAPEETTDDDTSLSLLVASRLDEYFSGEGAVFDFPLLLKGTVFQKEVWNILLTIPYGETMTYGEIAGMIALRRGMKRMSAEAVGQAVGSNRLPIVIPCHRVLGRGGRLTGYSGGLDRKIYLLDLEGIEYRK